LRNFSRFEFSERYNISASKLGDVDFGPCRVLAGAVSSNCALDRVNESVLELFDKGWELKIMLFNCREHGLIPKEEPPSP
jgi:hypothetical protein